MKIQSITVNVSEEVLNNSTKAESSKCMIAQALRKKGAYSVNVTAESARFNLGDTRYHYPLPAKAAVKLIEFDKGNIPEPFKFVLKANTGTCAPVARPVRKSRGKTKKQSTKPTTLRCKRRFHGLRVIEKVK